VSLFVCVCVFGVGKTVGENEIARASTLTIPPSLPPSLSSSFRSDRDEEEIILVPSGPGGKKKIAMTQAPQPVNDFLR
jgi:hypothetical protein